MENITNTIAVNLQSLRKERQMTLQDLAELTGVSKSMLGEIERGASNPTITVLWKISTGLGIPISGLIHEQRPSYQLVHETEWRHLAGDNYNLSMIFECDQTRNFEVYHLEFQPRSAHESRSHQKGVVEYTMVYEGSLTIIVDGEAFVLHKGDSFIFNAENPHSYRNNGPHVVKAYSLIYYPFK